MCREIRTCPFWMMYISLPRSPSRKITDPAANLASSSLSLLDSPPPTTRTFGT
jgi:hypothetical protein